MSAIRWALIDTLHSYTGLPLPALDFSRLGKNVEAFGLLIEIHYKHFQYYSNMVVSTAIAYTCYRVKLGGLWPLGGLDVAFVVLEVIFFITSRDCLQLCAGAHKRSYVSQMVMWCRTARGSFRRSGRSPNAT